MLYAQGKKGKKATPKKAAAKKEEKTEEKEEKEEEKEVITSLWDDGEVCCVIGCHILSKHCPADVCGGDAWGGGWRGGATALPLIAEHARAKFGTQNTWPRRTCWLAPHGHWCSSQIQQLEF